MKIVNFVDSEDTLIIPYYENTESLYCLLDGEPSYSFDINNRIVLSESPERLIIFYKLHKLRPFYDYTLTTLKSNYRQIPDEKVIII